MILHQEPTTADEVRDRARAVQQRLREQRIVLPPVVIPVIPDPVPEPEPEPLMPDISKPIFIPPRPRSVAHIQRVISRRYEIPMKVLLSDIRMWHVSRPRQIGMFITRKVLKMSFPEIGRRWQRDHTTVLHAYTKTVERAARDPRLAAEIDSIEREIAADQSFRVGEG